MALKHTGKIIKDPEIKDILNPVALGDAFESLREEITKRIGYDGFEKISLLSAEIARHSWADAIAVLEKSPGLIDRMLKYGNKQLVINVFGLSLFIFPYSWKTALSMLENSLGIIEHIGFAGLEIIAEIGARIAPNCWLTAVGSFEKSAGLIDRLLKYGDKDLVMKVFRLGSKASHYSWQMAVCLLENSPGIIEKIGPEALEAIADFGAKIARHSWLPAVDMIEKSPTLIDRILAYGDKRLVKDVYCICSRIGDQCWRTALHLLEKSPDILVRAGSTGFEKIAERASELSGVKYERAISFINGESFESALFIDEFSYGIELKKVKPILSNYLNALLSYRVELAESKDHYTDGKKIFLPEIINDFEEKQKNFTAYKVFATHEEAHIEYGSFDFSLSKIEDVVLRIRERYGGKWDNNE